MATPEAGDTLMNVVTGYIVDNEDAVGMRFASIDWPTFDKWSRRRSRMCQPSVAPSRSTLRQSATKTLPAIGERRESSTSLMSRARSSDTRLRTRLNTAGLPPADCLGDVNR